MHTVYDVVSGVIIFCSLVHTILPPWDGYADFPRFQKYYKACVYTVGYIALNARSTVHPSISTAEGTKVSDLSQQVKDN